MVRRQLGLVWGIVGQCQDGPSGKDSVTPNGAYGAILSYEPTYLTSGDDVMPADSFKEYPKLRCPYISWPGIIRRLV